MKENLLAVAGRKRLAGKKKQKANISACHRIAIFA